MALMTREEFNDSLWRMIGPDKLKDIVDGVKGDLAKAYGLGQPGTLSTGPQANPAFQSWKAPEAPNWRNEPPTPAPTTPDWGDAEKPGSYQGSQGLAGVQAGQQSSPITTWGEYDTGTPARIPQPDSSDITDWGPYETGRAAIISPINWQTSPQTATGNVNRPSTSVSSTDPWANAFIAAHGRAPDEYDAMVRDRMSGWMQPGQTPTQNDWERLTFQLRKEGKEGPGKSMNVRPGEPGYLAAGETAQTAAAKGSTQMPSSLGQPSYAAQSISAERAAAYGLSPNYATYKPIIEEHAQKYGVDPNLITALIQNESAFNAQATSSAGAQGLMQIMPETGRGLGLTPGADAYDPRSNIDAGTKYFASQMTAYKDQGDMQIPYALAAYNWGGANVNAAIRGEKQLPAETSNYIKAVIKQWQAMAKGSQ